MRIRGFPVDAGDEVAVGCAGGVKVVSSFFEFLAQVEYLLFELVGLDYSIWPGWRSLPGWDHP
jgi:hypothetical protein